MTCLDVLLTLGFVAGVAFSVALTVFIIFEERK